MTTAARPKGTTRKPIQTLMSVEEFGVQPRQDTSPKGRVTRGIKSLFDKAFLESRGVIVQEDYSYRLQPAERETNINWYEGERYCEITTTEVKWVRRLLALGCLPHAVQAYANTQSWYFLQVPRGFIGLPVNRKRAK